MILLRLNIFTVYYKNKWVVVVCPAELKAAVWIVLCFTVTTHLSPRQRNPWQSFLGLCYSAKLSTRAAVAVPLLRYSVVKLL